MDQEEPAPLDPNELRLAANGRFAANALDEALPLYSLAVEVARKRMEQQQQEQHESGDNNDNGGTVQDPDLVIHLCNRSACHYKMEMYEEARSDAAEAVSLSDGQNSKAYFRLARAQLAMKDYNSALVTIAKAIAYCEEQLEWQEQLKAMANNDYDDDNNDDEKSSSSSSNDNDEKSSNPLILQKLEFEKLRTLTLRKQKQSAANPDEQSPQDIKSIKLEPRTPSIREFARSTKSSDNYSPLGEGNFSTVVVCQHKLTEEKFALKIIEKEECKKLAKRQHPNVYNEVAMERRILTQKRLPHHINIIEAYHAMQDYGSLYFLMELHQEHGDLWSKIRYQKKMVGIHSSTIRTYAYELLAALEHCHEHGVVHRDIKPENVLLSEKGGHVVLIDFGTAKDLKYTDLNGPEFVGTPDFMSPEAVKEFEKGGNGCDFTADLWALGVVLYQMYSGALPFESQSPYLGFLKIQRGVYGRNLGVWDDDAWDLIQKLLKVDPNERLGAGTFEWIAPPKKEKKDGTANDSESKDAGQEKKEEEDTKQTSPLGQIIPHGNGYDAIREHPFFANHKSKIVNETNSHLKSFFDDKPVSQPIPSMRDLAIRATAHFIDQSSLDVDLEDAHPPGDGSSYDVLRLKPSDRQHVMHLLDRLHLLKEPRIYRRFFLSKQDARLGRVRPESHQVMGLTQMNDKMGQQRGHNEDQGHPDEQVPASRLLGSTKTEIHHVTNPLFCKSINDQCSSPGNETQRKQYIKQLKESIRLVNRVRPTVVIACGYFDDSCRKILSKVNETVPVILHDGSSYFNFWIYGAHCVAIPMKYFCTDGGSEIDEATRNEALAWFRSELEQMKTARSAGYVFVDSDARDIPGNWIAKMGKSHVMGLLGLCKDGSSESEGQDAVNNEDGNVENKLLFETQFVVAEHENGNATENADEIDDDISTSSSESDDELSPQDEHVMHIVGRIENGVRCITAPEEELIWDAEVLL